MPSLSIQGPAEFYFSGAKVQYQPLTETVSMAAEVVAAEAKQLPSPFQGSSTGGRVPAKHFCRWE